MGLCLSGVTTPVPGSSPASSLPIVRTWVTEQGQEQNFPPHGPHTAQTAVNVTPAGHLWEALEFLKISFDEGKNGRLAGEGGQPHRGDMETELWEERGAQGLAGPEGQACKGSAGSNDLCGVPARSLTLPSRESWSRVALTPPLT